MRRCRSSRRIATAVPRRILGTAAPSLDGGAAVGPRRRGTEPRHIHIQVELPVEGGIEARIGRVRLRAGGGPPGREESLEALGPTTGGVDLDPCVVAREGAHVPRSFLEPINTDTAYHMARYRRLLTHVTQTTSRL